MKFKLKRHRKYLLVGGLLLATAMPSLCDLRYRRHRLRPDQLRQSSLPGHHRPQPAQDRPEQRRALLIQAAMANDSQPTQERERGEYVWRDEWNEHGSQQQLAERIDDGLEDCDRPDQQHTNSYLQGQTPGNSTQLSQLAMIEMSDSVSPDCLTAIGQYRAGRAQNQSANSALSSQQFDSTSATNSEVEQLNLLNAAEAQKLSEMQLQGTMQICLASQMTVANMQQRNAAAQDLNSAATVQQQRATNDTSAAKESNTWQTYIP